MKKLKLMTIVGTRPEIIRLSEVIKLADRSFNHILVHTGQNWDYNLNQIFFEELGIRKPDYFLKCAGDNLGVTIGNIIANTYEVMQNEKPDAVLILGDTNSSLSAISAKRLKIPIFHMEAGNRCWDWNVSEMINRKIVDHISDVNLPYTEHARRYLLSEGIDGKTVFVTGSPMREVLEKNKERIENSNVLEDLNLKRNKYIIVSAHREENIDNEKNFFMLMNTINSIAEKYSMEVIYSVHPRSKKFIEKRNFKFHPLVRTLKPFGFFEYTLSEESSILGFSAVLLRTSTERPEVIDKGSIVIGGIEEKTVKQSIELAISLQRDIEVNKLAIDYMDNNVSEKVVRVIQGYTQIINKCVWMKG